MNDLNVGVVFLAGAAVIAFLFFVYKKVKARNERGNTPGTAGGRPRPTKQK